MRQVSIRDFRANMSMHLFDLPFEITKNGFVVAKVVAPGISQPDADQPWRVKIKPMPKTQKK